MQMGANVTVTPGLDEGKYGKKRRTRTSDGSPSQTPETSTQDNIAKLAYALWERNGCPQGSAECDWQEAERQLCQPNVSYADR